MLDFSSFECDKCGACCRNLLIEATFIDAQREPRLYEIRPRLDRSALRQNEKSILLYSVETKACPFLNANNECGIYATRPNCCVAVEPGDAKCQQARRMQSLPMLRDRAGNLPAIEVLSASCEEYGLNLEEIIDG